MTDESSNSYDKHLLKKLKILASVYSCVPHRGSEPGIGWNTIKSVAKSHEIHVITRSENRQRIEDDLNVDPIPNLQFYYYDLTERSSVYFKNGFGAKLYECNLFV